MSLLQIYLLGPLEIHHAGRPLALPPTVKSQSLLAYLLLHRHQVHARDPLAGRFWGDRPDNRARGSLNTALWHLRRCFPDQRFFDSRAATIQVDPDAQLWIDTEEFVRLAGSSAVDDLEAAVALYRGDLLEDFYEDWITDARYQYQARLRETLETLLLAYEKRGDPQGALSAAQALLAQDPLREAVHRAAMRALVRLGRPAEALAQYRRCQELLARELNLRPMAETRELLETIELMTGRPDTADRAAAVPGLLPSPASQDRAVDLFNPAAAVPLIGREPQFALFQDCWRESLSGGPPLVMISGEAGLGKTRLAQAFADHLHQQNHRVAWGACYQFERLIPYQPIAEALGTLLSGLSAEQLHALPGWVLSETARLLPELHEKIPGLALALPAQSRQDRARLFEGLARFLQAALASGPLLIVLEDLHWAAESTLQLLHYLVRQLQADPVLFLGTFRPEEAAGDHPLPALLAQLQAADSLRRIQLTPLAAGEVEALLQQLSGAGDRVNQLARRLYQESEGNPFFLVESLKALFQMDRLQLGDQRWEGDFDAISRTQFQVPLSVGAVLQERVRRLDGPTRTALRQAAVLGREFDFRPLQLALDAGLKATLENIDALLRRRLIEEGRGRAGLDYLFSHHKIQELVYADLDPRLRAHLHARAAAALEKTHADRLEAIASELAHHYLAACELEPTLGDQAVTYLMLAGESAADLQAYSEAITCYDQALEVLDCLPDTPENRTRRFDCLLDFAASGWRGDSPHCLPLVEQAEQLFDRMADPSSLRRARLLYLQGRVQFSLGRQREAVAYYEQVLPLAQSLEEPEWVAVSSSAIGQTLALQGRLDRAEPLLQEAEGHFRRTENWSEWIRACTYLAVMQAGLGRTRQTVETARAGVERARKQGQPADLFLILMGSSHSLIGAGDPVGGLAAAVEAHQVASQSGHRGYQALAFIYQAWAQLRLGRYDPACASLDRFRKGVGEIALSNITLSDYGAAVELELALRTGRISEALDLAQSALELAQEFGSLFAEGWVRRVWGQALAARNPPDWEGAVRELVRSANLFESGRALLELAHTYLAWGQLCREQGDLVGARHHWQLAADQYEASELDTELEATRALLDQLPPARD